MLVTLCTIFAWIALSFSGSAGTRTDTFGCQPWSVDGVTKPRYFQQSCYVESTFTADWEAARDFCWNNGGYLVKLTSEAEYKFNFGTKRCYYLSLSKWDGGWRWLDGSLPTYSDWETSSPFSFRGVRLIHDCAAMCAERNIWGQSSGYAWQAQPCDRSWNFICEFDAIPISVTTPSSQTPQITETPFPTPLSTPLSTPPPTPLSTPLPTPLSTPLPTPLSTPLPTPLPTPLLTPLPTPLSTPLLTPLPTPLLTSTALAKPAVDRQQRRTRVQKRKAKIAFRRCDTFPFYRLTSQPDLEERVSFVTSCSRLCMKQLNPCAIFNFHTKSKTCRGFTSTHVLDRGKVQEADWQVWEMVEYV